jgi:hypothetical protein
VAQADLNQKQSNITAPTPPAGEQAGETVGTTGFTALELGVQETGSTTPAATTTVSNVVSASTTPATTTTTTTSTTSTGSTPTSHGEHSLVVGQHGHHQFAATDAAVSDFDLADLYV